MGKKKSVVLMTLLTIVIAVLCVIAAFPKFTIPGTVKQWNPATLQYDLGADLGGGYYAYYYPEGVITQSEYDNDLASLKEAEEAVLADADASQSEKDAATADRLEYEESYIQVQGSGSSLYFSTDEKLNIVAGGELTPAFKEAFEKAAKAIAARYEAKSYSDYRVAIVEGYSIRVELPMSEDTQKASILLTSFAKMGKLTLHKGDELIDELKKSDVTIKDLIKSVSIKTLNVGKNAYLELQFTKAGKDMLQAIKGDLSSSASGSSGGTTTALNLKVNDETIIDIYSDNITDENVVRIIYVEGLNKDYLETVKIMLDSLISGAEYDITFEISPVRTFDPVYGKNVLTLLYIALAIAIVAIIALAIVMMGRFGVVSCYNTLSYFIVTVLCFAFITAGTFEITLGSVLVFLIGLVLINLVQYYIYNAIKAEFALGKTVESSVKGGYRKTLLTVVDIYAVALLGALALLIGAPGLHTVALQAIICVVTAAFMNLLWARFINYTFLSASKNKYKYFRFVREDDDDDE